jgi:hypothetical protein
MKTILVIYNWILAAGFTALAFLGLVAMTRDKIDLELKLSLVDISILAISIGMAISSAITAGYLLFR